jgi:hypothetical protein
MELKKFMELAEEERERLKLDEIPLLYTKDMHGMSGQTMTSADDKGNILLCTVSFDMDSISYMDSRQAVEIIRHELAHVIANKESIENSEGTCEGHTKRWAEIFLSINNNVVSSAHQKRQIEKALNKKLPDPPKYNPIKEYAEKLSKLSFLEKQREAFKQIDYLSFIIMEIIFAVLFSLSAVVIITSPLLSQYQNLSGLNGLTLVDSTMIGFAFAIAGIWNSFFRSSIFGRLGAMLSRIITLGINGFLFVMVGFYLTQLLQPVNWSFYVSVFPLLIFFITIFLISVLVRVILAFIKGDWATFNLLWWGRN